MNDFHKLDVYSDVTLFDSSKDFQHLQNPTYKKAWKESASSRVVEYANSLKDADLCILPMQWNYYLHKKRVKEVIEFCERAHKAEKLVVIWASGDFEKIIPAKNPILFQPGLNRSRHRSHQYAFEVPAFVRDYVETYKNGVLPIRQKQDKPRIGFCGQAAGRLPGLAVWLSTGLKLRILNALGRAKEVPPPLVPPWRLRGKVLRLLQQSSLVETDFIIRKRYRAGVRDKQQRNDPSHPTNVEFVNNIFNTDYTVCVRGGGNFSKRLYETLSCGRIPVFIDTDSVLPYDFKVDWKQYCVWVDKSEVPHIAEKVAEFHDQLTPAQFEDLQLACRQLWLDRLSKQGFLNHFHEHFYFL